MFTSTSKLLPTCLKVEPPSIVTFTFTLATFVFYKIHLLDFLIFISQTEHSFSESQTVVSSNDITLPEGTKARGVYLALREQIMSGRLSDGDKLPTEQRIAESYGVSRATVRRALDVLADAGVIKRRAGSGTTVCATDMKQRAAMNFNTLMPQLVEKGQKTEAKLLSFSYEKSPDYVTKAMRWKTSQVVQVSTRVRLIDEIPRTRTSLGEVRTLIIAVAP